jgi:hypothetical protein
MEKEKRQEDGNRYQYATDEQTLLHVGDVERTQHFVIGAGGRKYGRNKKAPVHCNERDHGHDVSKEEKCKKTVTTSTRRNNLRGFQRRNSVVLWWWRTSCRWNSDRGWWCRSIPFTVLGHRPSRLGRPFHK